MLGFRGEAARVKQQVGGGEARARLAKADSAESGEPSASTVVFDISNMNGEWHNASASLESAAPCLLSSLQLVMSFRWIPELGLSRGPGHRSLFFSLTRSGSYWSILLRLQ